MSKISDPVRKTNRKQHRGAPPAQGPLQEAGRASLFPAAKTGLSLTTSPRCPGWPGNPSFPGGPCGQSNGAESAAGGRWGDGG